MIIPTLYGGIGNMLFQLCCAIGTAKKYDDSWAIPRQTLAPLTEWQVWLNDNPRIPKIDKAELEGEWTSWKERSHAYEDIPLIHNNKLNNKLRLTGYYQSFRYFENYRNDILKILGFRYMPGMAGWVGIHRRLGDYKLHPDKFHLATDDYFRQAMKIFMMNGKTRFQVFSDDVDECKKFFTSQNFPRATFSFPNGNAVTDMELFSSCDGNIISNSTFSLFGAWANGNIEKMVVTPSKDCWFKDDTNTNDMIPQGWIQMRFR